MPSVRGKMGPAARCISANVDVDQLARTLRDRLRLPLMLLGIAIAAAAALYAWLFGGRYVSTDDAYTQAARASISCNIGALAAQRGHGPFQPLAQHRQQRRHRHCAG